MFTKETSNIFCPETDTSSSLTSSLFLCYSLWFPHLHLGLPSKLLPRRGMYYSVLRTKWNLLVQWVNLPHYKSHKGFSFRHSSETPGAGEVLLVSSYDLAKYMIRLLHRDFTEYIEVLYIQGTWIVYETTNSSSVPGCTTCYLRDACLNTRVGTFCIRYSG